MKQKTTKKTTENYQKIKKQIFTCEYCDYTTCDASNFNKHINTRRHKMKQTTTILTDPDKYKVFTCKICNQIFKSRTTLWRHEKTCKEGVNDESIHEVKKELDRLQKENARLKTELHEAKDSKPSQMITNNNTFNIQLFLNEECKNAMNMGDFIKTIKLSLDDLDFSMKNGKVEAVSKIFIKELNDLATIERPIHCKMNDTNNIMYIKENNIWEEDSDNKILEASIDNIETNHYKLLEEWEKSNPNWMNVEDLRDTYLDMVKKSMSKLTEKEKLDIIKNISNLTKLE